MNKSITLDDVLVYRVCVQGRLDAMWSEVVALAISDESADPSVTTLIGRVDQAGLHGALRTLYSIGLPLISVSCETPA